MASVFTHQLFTDIASANYRGSFFLQIFFSSGDSSANLSFALKRGFV